MKTYKMVAVLCVVFLGFPLMGMDNNQVRERLEAILPLNAHVGIIVKSLDDDQVVYGHNENLLFMPGSTLKIVTAVAALKSLGANFTYSSQLLVDPNSSSEPNVFYLKFSGDPTLTGKDLINLFRLLEGIEVCGTGGKIIYDVEDYNVPRINKAWMLSDIETCEMGPVSKAMIDGNYYHFEIYPAKELLEPSILKGKLGIEPRYMIDNQVITNSDEEYTWRSYGFVGDVLRIQGKAGINLKPQRIELPVDDLGFYIQQNINKALKESGTKLKYEIISGKIPKDAILVGEHKSQTLSAIISEGLKYSINLPFGVLPLELAALENPSANSWRKASNILSELIKKNYSIDLSGAVIDDGIGLSRYNLMSPKQLSEVLIAAYRDSSISSHFVNGLAQNGREGDLKNRLNEPTCIGRVNGKTGSMTGVSGYAGYLETLKGKRLCFVIFINGYSGPIQPYRDFQDKFCRILIEQL
jgi:D-alanyl-D-alanine carboxypeptidase/D-alanyl-D-alanine-endopeptidase (penicillin-binding protein 4)